MLQYSEELTIQASVEKVFDRLTKPEAISKWFPHLEKIEFFGSSTSRGTALKMTMLGNESNKSPHHYEGKVTACFTGREYGFEFGNKDFTNQMMFRVQNAGTDRARVQLEATMSYTHTFAERLARFFSWITRSKLKNTLKGLKKLCEKEIHMKEKTPFKLSPRLVAIFFLVDLLIVGAVIYYYKFGLAGFAL